MLKEATRKQPTNVSVESHLPTEEQIRLRAYELYEARGRQDGHELEDWFEAESEFNEEQVEAAAA
jgi:hypothetical protein